MPQALAIGALAAGTVYASNQAKKGSEALAASADRASALATQPRRTQYGSYIDPTGSLSQFVDPITGQLNLAPIQSQQPQGGLSGFIAGRPSLIPQTGGSGGFLSAAGSRTINPPSVGMTFLDPSIRAMREQSLANVPSYQSILRPQLDSALQGLGQTRGRLEELYGQTNDNAFMDPLLQRLALARGELTRGLVNRGLGGSSFQASALGNFESAAAPGIAQARQQGLQARQGLLTDLANADVQSLSTAGAGVAQLQNLDNLYASVAGQNLQQELSALGLSQADIGALLGAAQLSGQAGQLRADASGRLLYGAGQLLPLLGQMGGASTPTGMSQANWV